MTDAVEDQPNRQMTAVQILLLAVLIAAGFTVMNWIQTDRYPFAKDPIYATDDMVRMVTVRDWLNGQSWFDPVLHGLGPASGTVMHWSRLIDLPIGLLILAGDRLGIDGERLAQVVWPFLTFCTAIAAVLVALRRASGTSGVVAAIVIGGFGLTSYSLFASGFIDHHNAQLALSLWLVALITPGGTNTRRDLALAALLTSLMLAIGMEGLPLAVAGAVAVYLRLVIEREAFVPAARAYGLVLALSHAALFILLIAPSRYRDVYCDSFSLFHLVSAAIGGLVLWAGLTVSISRQRIPAAEIIVPLFAATAVMLAAVLLFPECLRNPIAQLDPKMREFWIDKVIEAQSALQIARLDPWLLPYMFVLPVLALVTGGLTVIRQSTGSRYNTIMIFVAIASAVTVFQLRGAQLSTPMAALALAMLVARFGEQQGKHKPLLLLAALAFSCAIVWRLLVVVAMTLADAQSGPLITAATNFFKASCKAPQAIESLKAEQPGLVAAANSIGPAILYSTQHRVLSGPYHRNVEGNLAWINAMTGSADDAHVIFAKAGVTILALCPSDSDEIDFKTAKPDGFAAQLIAGKIPDWLEPVASTNNAPLRLFHVKP